MNKSRRLLTLIAYIASISVLSARNIPYFPSAGIWAPGSLEEDYDPFPHTPIDQYSIYLILIGLFIGISLYISNKKIKFKI